MTDTRAQFIAGLRAFADWLDANPDVEAPRDQRFLLALSINPAVAEFAAQHGLETTADDEGNLSATVTFGPVHYKAYGYTDFAAHCDANAERNARDWADRNGLQIAPQTT